MRQETRYLRTIDGVYVAYQVVGSGPVDVAVDFHHFAGNVDLIWRSRTGVRSWWVWRGSLV